MNTRLILTASAVVLGAVGVLLTFNPEILLSQMGLSTSRLGLIMGQVLGGLYFGFAILNWMAKGSRIGGIYNRPIAVANFAHFFIAGMAFIKAVASDSSLPVYIWVSAFVYSFFAIAFTIILFRSPVD